MAGFRSMVRWSFEKSYAFGKLALQAKSTKWPGLCRSAIYILFVALLLSIAQATLHLWLAITLSNLPSEVKGCYEGNGLAGFPMPHERTYRPVTYADIRGKRGFSIRANSSNGIIALAAALPFMTLLLLLMTTSLHFSKRGMQNRDGILFGFVLLLSYLGILGSSVFLDIDTDDVRTDFDWCWLDEAQIIPLLAAREARLRVRTTAGAVIGIEIACAILYIFTSFHAACSNAKDMRALGRRLEELSPDNTLVDNRSSTHLTPNDIRNHNDDSHITPQDPFSDHRNIVTIYDGQNNDEIVTHTPSGQPFVDPAPQSQVTNELPDVQLANGELGSYCSRHTERPVSPTIRLECELASGAEVFSMRHGTDNEGVGTRDHDRDSKALNALHRDLHPQETAGIEEMSVIEDVPLEGVNPFEVCSNVVEDANDPALANTQDVTGDTEGVDVRWNPKAYASEIAWGEVATATSGEYEDKSNETIKNNGESMVTSSQTNEKVRGK